MIEKFKNTFKYIKEKRFDTLAGTLSFFFILSFIPLLFLCIGLYVKIGSWINIETPIPEALEDFISFDLNAGVSILFLLTTLYSASKFFTQLSKTGEIIYNMKTSKVNIKTQIFSCLFVLLMMAVVSSGLLFVAVVQTYFTSTVAKVFIQIATYLLLLLTLFIFLLIINRRACQKDAKFKEINKGIIFSLIYVTVVSALFIFYVSNFADYDKLYGFFSTVIVIFLYVFLIMQGVVIGIILNEKRINKK